MDKRAKLILVDDESKVLQQTAMVLDGDLGPDDIQKMADLLKEWVRDNGEASLRA